MILLGHDLWRHVSGGSTGISVILFSEGLCPNQLCTNSLRGTDRTLIVKDEVLWFYVSVNYALLMHVL